MRPPHFLRFEIRSADGEYNFCHDVSLSTCTVFECQPPGMAPYVYPLSGRMLGSNGQIIDAEDAIGSPEEGETWNLGINFAVNGFYTPAPTQLPDPDTPAPRRAPIAPVTPSPVTPEPSTPEPTAEPTRPDNPVMHDKEIIGYYSTWQWYDRNKLAAPDRLDFSKYTIINFAFFQRDDDGSLMGTDGWADFNPR